MSPLPGVRRSTVGAGAPSRRSTVSSARGRAVSIGSETVDQREGVPAPNVERRTPGKGDIFKNPDLARTLRLIGEKGRDVFYKGAIADKIDAFMRANGGFLRKTDFEKHTSTWIEPVSVNYRGYDIF